MASTTVKPYPHIQMNVKDNSIATVNIVETLPVHRPIYVMKTQKGPLGRPVWYNSYSEAVASIGAETFNPANKNYFSKAAAFLRATMVNNGAFIARYLPSGYATSGIMIYAEVSELSTTASSSGVPQYEIDEATGTRVQEFDDSENLWVDKFKRDAYDNIIMEDGVKILFKSRALTDDDYVISGDPTSGIKMTYTKTTGSVIFPVLALVAANPGVYGNDLGVTLFYSPKSNDSSDVTSYGTLFYNIGFSEREYNSSTWNAITDIYNRDNCAFAANPNAVNPDTGALMNLDAILDKGFSDTTHQLPVNFSFSEKNLNYIGLIIAAYEDDCAATAEGSPISKSLNGYGNATIGYLTEADKTAIKDWFKGTSAPDPITVISEPDYGYKVNVISGRNLIDVPYDHTMINIAFNSSDEKITPVSGTASLTASVVINLLGGSDGTFVDDEGNSTSSDSTWASNDEAMYNFVKLRTVDVKDQIIDSLRYPFTHIFDIGYSMKTKKAILDFLDIRNDVIAILSSQVLMADGSGRPISQNDQATDEGNGEALRSYALLMRESVLYGTDCMRASIYCHSGHLVDTTSYSGILPFTYWAAVQYSLYGNTTYMKPDEPRGTPKSYNTLFKDWNWRNYRPDAQSRVWDGGMNYVQSADMTRIFYPSLRTVYRASTSVLIDEWVVAGIVYAKYVCRRAWVMFSGRNDSASVLQGLIKKYLDTEISHLFNGRYAFDVSVYQTAEEQELGYIQHVKLSITAGATNRVFDVDIEVNREGYTAQE